LLSPIVFLGILGFVVVVVVVVVLVVVDLYHQFIHVQQKGDCIWPCTPHWGA